MGIERAATTYICDISGLADEAIEDAEGVDEDDPLQDAPMGWSQILVRTRMVNPNHIQANHVYNQAIAEVKSQMKDEKDPARVNAALFALEQQFAPILDTPMFITNESEMWVHPQYIAELMNRLDPETAEDHALTAREIQEEGQAVIDALEAPASETETAAEPESSTKPKAKRTRKKAPAKTEAQAK